MVKKLIVLLAAGVFLLTLGGPAIAAGMGGDVKGTVTKIEGGKVTIKDSMGMEQTVEPKNPDALSALKVGDHASVKDGILVKEGGTGSTAPPAGPKY